MKLRHELDFTDRMATKRDHGTIGLLYVHSWYDDTTGPCKGNRLGYQVLVFKTATDAASWLEAQNTNEVAPVLPMPTAYAS